MESKLLCRLCIFQKFNKPVVAIRCRIALSASHVSDAENLLGWHAGIQSFRNLCEK